MAARAGFWTALLMAAALPYGGVGADSRSCTITVEQSGENILDCLKSSKPCQTLDYVLQNFDHAAASCPDGEHNVLVGYNHSINSTSLVRVNFTRWQLAETASLTIAGSSARGLPSQHFM